MLFIGVLTRVYNLSLSVQRMCAAFCYSTSDHKVENQFRFSSNLLNMIIRHNFKTIESFL